MDKATLQRQDEFLWIIPPRGRMLVPAMLFASEELVAAMDAKVFEQLANIASLPGIVKASFGMPDAHWGYGFPIGGVAAFDPGRGGVVSAGGVGFDISCGVRTLLTGLRASEVIPLRDKLANALFAAIPAGVGSTGRIRLSVGETDRMLAGGAQWAVEQGYGVGEDLRRIESNGAVPGADCAAVSERARMRQRDEMGTLGSGNHYLEVQEVAEVYDGPAAAAFGLSKGEIVVGMHCGSRGLGHQIATEFSSSMLRAAGRHGILLPDRELACAPIESEEGRKYLGAMRAAANCALANRQILTHLARECFRRMFGLEKMPLLYDVSHNLCCPEEHSIEGKPRLVYVHRKGATRALGPGSPLLPEEFRSVGQPVLIGGTMGTSSYVLAGAGGSAGLSFNSACHGAGRRMSRTQAARQWQGRDVLKGLAARNIAVRGNSARGIAEEAPGAYKDIDEVVETTERAGLARKVARLAPIACIKG